MSAFLALRWAAEASPVPAQALGTTKRRTRVHSTRVYCLSHQGLSEVKSEGFREADSGLDNFLKS